MFRQMYLKPAVGFQQKTDNKAKAASDRRTVPYKTADASVCTKGINCAAK